MRGTASISVKLNPDRVQNHLSIQVGTNIFILKWIVIKEVFAGQVFEKIFLRSKSSEKGRNREARLFTIPNHFEILNETNFNEHIFPPKVLNHPKVIRKSKTAHENLISEMIKTKTPRKVPHSNTRPQVERKHSNIVLQVSESSQFAANQ